MRTFGGGDERPDHALADQHTAGLDEIVARIEFLACVGVGSAGDDVDAVFNDVVRRGCGWARLSADAGSDPERLVSEALAGCSVEAGGGVFVREHDDGVAGRDTVWEPDVEAG